jgi:mannose/fructose/N-acetylgalactosamine-specific phosphotransferase system component IID
MKIDKSQLWPKEGKLKKGLIILGIVIVGSLLMTLIEEKTNIKLSKRVPFVIALACLAVWFYNPDKPEANPPAQ